MRRMKKVLNYYEKYIYEIKTCFLRKFIDWWSQSAKKSKKCACNWEKIEQMHPYKDAHCIVENESKSNASDITLSLICPLFNSMKYIDDLIDSLVNQKTKYLYEVILIDDGSKDNTLVRANEYQKKYSKILNVVHQKK